MTGSRILERFALDVRFGWRSSRRDPGFTVLTVLILALGIGASTAVFSLVSTVLLRPLPFLEPDRLVVLWEDFSAVGGPSRVELAPATFVEWQMRSRSFDDMAVLYAGPENLTGGAAPEQISTVRTTTNLFSILGMQPILGRTFAADDESATAEPVAVISSTLWQRRYAADPAIIGSTITLGGLARTVIGIVPPDFRFPNTDAEIWVPVQFAPQQLAQTDGYYLTAVARLRDSVSLAQAQLEMSSVAETIAAERGSDTLVGATVAPLHEQISRDARPTLYVLLAAVGAVLLITCANVANLLLARGTLRVRELALRQALGSGRGRIVQQLLTESAMLAVVGAVAGVSLSTLSFGYLARLLPDTLPAGASPSLDLGVLAFSVAIVFATVLLFGMGPALAAARREFGDALKQASGQVAARGSRIRSGLVVAEIVFTAVLLAAAGLLLRSYEQVLDVDPGFQSEGMLLLRTPLDGNRYGELESRVAFLDSVIERVSAIPGVSRAEYVNAPPIVFTGGRMLLHIDGRPEPAPDEIVRYITSTRIVSDAYLETLGLPLISGRHLDTRDAVGSTPSVVINQTMAERHWPGENPLGARLRLGDGTLFTVIGVVGDMRQIGLDEPAEPETYFSYRQPPNRAPIFWPQYLMLRAQGEPVDLAAAVRRAVWSVDPEQPVSQLRTMDSVVDAQLLSRDTQMTLVGVFAALALLLASVGIYAVLAHAVAQQKPEIGLRMALGAPRAKVIGDVLRRAFTLALIGIGIGLACAFALTRLLESFLFEVHPGDPLTYLSAIAVLLITTAIASYVPAMRAAGVDPMNALRSQ